MLFFIKKIRVLAVDVVVYSVEGVELESWDQRTRFHKIVVARKDFLEKRGTDTVPAEHFGYMGMVQIGLEVVLALELTEWVYCQVLQRCIAVHAFGSNIL